MENLVKKSDEHSNKGVAVQLPAENARSVVLVSRVLPGVIVWGTWAGMLVADLVLLGHFAHNIPYRDDWGLLAAPAVGHAPESWFHYFWDQVYEHRYPLVKMIDLGLIKLCGVDFRAPQYFRVFILGVLAFAFIRVAKRLRGWTSYTDAFIPLALLQCRFSPAGGAWLGTAYLFPSAVACFVLVVVARRGIELTLWAGVLAGICLVLLPLCSAGGLLYLPFLTLWFGLAALYSWRSGTAKRKRDAAVFVSFILAAVLLTAFYFKGYDRDAGATYASHGSNWWASLKTSIAFLTASFGQAPQSFWPIAGYAMAGLLTLTVGVLAFYAWRGPGPKRSRALGLLLFLAACGSLAFGIGWGRASAGGALIGFTYLTLPVPVLCCIFFALEICRPSKFASVSQTVLLACMASAVYVNTVAAYGEESGWHAHLTDFEHDMHAGSPPFALLTRYLDDLGIQDAGAADVLYMLRDAGFGPFRALRNDPPFREVAIPLEPKDVHEAEWLGGVAHGKNEQSYITFVLPEPMFVARICVRYNSLTAAYPFKVSWKKPGDPGFPETPQYQYGLYPPDPFDVGVADTIDAFRIHFGNEPIDFRISEIVALIPEE